MQLQARANKLAANLGGVTNIVGMEAGEQLLVIQVVHLEYVEIDRIASDPFVAEVILGKTSVSILTTDKSARHLLTGLRLSETGQEEVSEAPFQLFVHLRNFLLPLLSTIMAGGIIQAIVVLFLSFSMFESVTETSTTLSTIFTLVFMILPVLIAFSSAKYYQTNPYIAAAITGMMLQPAVSEFVSTRMLEQVLNFPLINNHQYNTILPVLVLVPFLAYIDHYLVQRVAPRMRPMLQPFILMGTGLIFGVVVLLPLMAIASHVLVAIFIIIAEQVPFLSTLLMGAFGPLFVVTGTHYSFFEAVNQSLVTRGYDSLLGPGMLISNAAHVGVALALMLKSRKKTYRVYSGVSGLLALLGVTQPIIYGGELILKNLLWYVMIGGGAGGLVAGLFQLKMYQFMNPNILSMLAFVDSTGNILVAISSMLVAAIVAFALTFSRPIYELSDEEIRIATTGQGRDVIE